VTAASEASHAPRTALITGAAGQDGRLLSARLLAQGHAVVGIVRPGTALPPGPPALRFIEADLREPGLFDRLLRELRPDEIYHLAAFHHSAQEAGAGCDVLRSRRQMVDSNFGVCSALAMALLETALPARLVFAASSQMYTPSDAVTLIDEDSPRRPSTFYGHVKAWSTELLGQLRAEHGLRASTAILFNHESSLRRPSFVSRKITLAAAAAAAGRPQPLRLMNLGARVDWSAAEDVVAALQAMAGAATPQDCIVASGRLRSVRELLAAAFGHVGLDWREHTQFDRDSVEPALCGNPQRLQALGWQPGLDFATWVGQMVDHDRRALQPD
jgi:GDPmannose 4,6-dehydratase